MWNKKTFLFCLFFIIGCIGTMEADAIAEHGWQMEKWTLHTTAEYKGYPWYEFTEIHIDDLNQPIVLSGFVFGESNDLKYRMIAFVLDKGAWVDSSIPLPTNTYCGGMLKNGKFYAYTANFPNRKSRRPVISLYGLDPNAKLVTEPAKKFEVDAAARTIKLLPLKGGIDKLFVIGQHIESRLYNPLNFILFLISAGHHGFVLRPFGAIFERDKFTDYYDVSAKFETNEDSQIENSVQSGYKIHCVSKKYKPYSSEAWVIQYLNFDLTNNSWTEPVQLFQGCKRDKGKFDLISSPTLASDGKNIYCSWSWHVQELVNNDYVPQKESGIYFCSKGDGSWSKPVKLADSGWNPQVFLDNKQTVHVIWSDDKGLYHKALMGDWTETKLVVKDRRIEAKTSPSVAVDKDNNLYVSYIREKLYIKNQPSLPAELVCFKFVCDANEDQPDK